MPPALGSLGHLADDRPPELAELDLEVLHGVPLPPGWSLADEEDCPEFVVRGPAGEARHLDPRLAARLAWRRWELQFSGAELWGGPPLPLPPGWRIVPPGPPSGRDLLGLASVIAAQLGELAFRLTGPGGTVFGQLPAVLVEAWQQYARHHRRASQRTAAGVAGVAALVGLVMIFVLAALGCDPAREMAEPWYTAIMTTSPRLYILVPVALALCGIIVACGDDSEPAEPVCEPGQGLFAPCNADEECADDRVCFAGMCSPRCVTGPEADCAMTWDGTTIMGTCVTSDSQQSVCGYPCDLFGATECPAAPQGMVCTEQFINPSRKFCSAATRCDK